LRVLIFWLLVLGHSFDVESQITYFQDIFHGEVSYVGFTSADGSGQIILPTNLNDGTIPKKLFLICYGVKGNNYTPSFKQFSVDGKLFQLDTLLKSSISVGNNTTITVGTDYNGHMTYIIDLTPYISEVNSNITINWIEDPFFPPTDCPSCHVSSPVLLILNENLSLPKISVSLFINDKNNDDDIFLKFENLNQAYFSFPIALGIQTDRLGWSNTDGYSFYLNQQNLGEIITSDPDQFNLFSGAMGCYHYSNNTITGLTGDSNDSLFSGVDPIIHNADGLAKINSYLNNDIQPIELKVSYVDYSLNQHNIFVSNLFAYSTPCQPQNVTVTPDTTICPNTQVQLSATGGTSSGSTPAYEWWPQKDLSCYDCPNPIFSGDSSQLYTVRIWGSDSCSVVRPIIIHVRTKPKTTLYDQSNSLCADSTAFVNWQTAGTNTYSLDNGTFQPAGFYNQLPAGEHLLTVRDAFGCTYDTLVLIDDYSSVVANLSVSPLSGQAPLVVQITNQSTEFTDYSWSVNNTIQPNASNSFEAFTAGEYIVQLIAWQNDPTCADTAFQTISVTSAGFYILGSSLVSASSNAQNTFLVLTNGTPIVKVTLYDAQGRLLKTKTNLQLIAGSNTIWSASELSDIASEMVLYRIEWQNAAESGELKGKVLFLK
jgi:PKD repeat protein